MTQFTLGINLGFATNRWPEPEVWARLVANDLGLRSVQLVADLLNPFWPDDVLERQIERVLEATQRYGLTIHSLMTSTYTRVNHLLYPHPELRQAWLDWFHRFIDIGARLGVEAVGSHFGILSMTDQADDAARRERLDKGVLSWQALTRHAADAGLRYLFYETMSIPRELGHTIDEARQLWSWVNEDAAVPLMLCLDVGHAPHPAERDPYLWLRELGGISRLVHLQQTEAGHSRHWPFTPEYNATGIIDPRRVLADLAGTGAKEIWLGFEIAHRERFEVEPLVLPELVESVRYWREALPKDGPWQPEVIA
ncbi:MAG: TIM barrel protein [Chloroflexi bacterium]|nr:TIM barrel protein [Chloroflexota bacterium]